MQRAPIESRLMPDAESPASVEEVTHAGDLARHRDEWRDLQARAKDALFFQTPEFVETWLEYFWPDRPLTILFVRRGGALTGLAPLVTDDEGRLACPGTVVLPADADFAIRGDLLSADGAEETLDAVVGHLRSTRGHVRLVLKHVRTESPLLEALEAVAGRHHLKTFTRETWTSPIVEFQHGWEAYLQSRSGHLRSELRRKSRKLEAAGTVTYLAATTPSECTRALEDMSVVEKSSWKQAHGNSLEFHPEEDGFLKKLARRFAERGWLRAYVLYLNSKPVAYVHGVVFRDEYYAFHTSFDDAYRDLSPGFVLFGHMLRDTCERGLRVFDFLGGEQRWKKEVATGERRHVDVCLFSRNQFRCLTCELYRGHVKPFVAARAPFVFRIGRWLRRSLSR